MRNAELSKKIFLAFLFLSMSWGICVAQYPAKITINVSSKFYDGKRLSLQAGSSASISNELDFKFVDSSENIGDFARSITLNEVNSEIKIILSYPHPFQFGYYDAATNSGKGSSYFFVDNKETTLKIKDLSKSHSVLTGKKSMINREYLSLQKLYSSYVDKKSLAITNLSEWLVLMQKYISKNPDSYVAMWDFIINYVEIQHKNAQSKVLAILPLFSKKIKETKTFLSLLETLEQDLILVKGVDMPNLFMEGQDSLLTIAAKNRYTLVDFWFAGCTPCIAQFPAFKDMYADHKSKGFELIGISTDQNESVWKTSIAKNQLKWIQYRDVSSRLYNQLNLRKSPSSFLIDQAGKIVAVDIKPEELKIFLQENLK